MEYGYYMELLGDYTQTNTNDLLSQGVAYVLVLVYLSHMNINAFRRVRRAGLFHFCKCSYNYHLIHQLIDQ